MSLGVSIYLGLDNKRQENINLLKKAYKLGFTRIFTSLHIPEANYTTLKSEVDELFDFAKQYKMDIISDISPDTFKFLGLQNKDFKSLRELGISTVRIDYGYSEKEIAELTKNKYGIKIQLNASTVTEEFFDTLDRYSPNYYNIDALHNFYPRIGTGISEHYMDKKNRILKKRGIQVGAFIQSNNKKRGPLMEGLPTLEDHRGVKVREAANHLFALGINSVFIGDSLPSDNELKDLKELNQEAVELDIKLKTTDLICIELLKKIYTSRIDEARDAIRTCESRMELKGKDILPNNTIYKCLGDITIDNKKYKRYMGELQILKTNLKSDHRTNVVASVLKEKLYLLKYICNGKKFYFNIVK